MNRLPGNPSLPPGCSAREIEARFGGEVCRECGAEDCDCECDAGYETPAERRERIEDEKADKNEI